MEPSITDNKTIRVMLTLCTAVLAGAVLYFAQSIFAPVAFALFIIAIVWPLQKLLQDRMPKLIALFFTILAILTVVIALASMIAWGFGEIGQWLARNSARYQALYDWTTEWLERHDIFIAGSFAERVNVTWLVRFFQVIAGKAKSLFGFSMLVVVFTLLGLLEVDDLKQKFGSLKNQSRTRKLLEAGAEIAAKFRKYMLVRTLMSILTGVAIWGFATLVGLELATAWGVIAFTLNYIPFIGPFVVTALPTLFAVAQFESWQSAIFILACVILIQFLIGSYFEPRFAGATLSISPFVVLFAVFFWSFMWGIPGAFIGVPLIIVLITICEKEPSSRWIAILLSGHPRTYKHG